MIYRSGFYGGKFIPFHKGHKYCIEYARRICEHLTVIFFMNGEDEKRIMSESCIISKSELDIRLRWNEVKSFVNSNDMRNIDLVALDCDMIYKSFPDVPQWDAETPFVKALVPDMDAVFSSEPSYDDYFKRAYPNAKHVLIDPPRIVVPISATKIRFMSDSEGMIWR